MTVKVPDEYQSWDFGFSAVDDPSELPQTAPATIDLNSKLDTILSKLHQLETAPTTVSSTMDKGTYEQNIAALERIIVPLLNNLLKTADKPYVYWPDRGPAIQSHLEKVLSITRGSS